jgi:carboxyl-terminal processing protease
MTRRYIHRSGVIACSIALLLLPRPVRSQADTLSLQRRIVIATRIYDAIQTNFAHWEAVPQLDLDAEYAKYAAAIATTNDRRAFDRASMAFVAALGNGHTWYGDWWLRRQDGQSLGFYAHPIGDQWVVTESVNPQVAIGDVVEAIDSIPIRTLYERDRALMFASDDRWRERSLFEHPYLFPKSFALHLAGGKTVAVTRSAPFMFHGDAPQADSIYRRDDVLVIRIPSFAKPQFEDSALAALRSAGAASAVVIDVRGNEGGAVPNRVIRAVMDRPYRGWTQATPSTMAMFRSWGVLGAHTLAVWPGDVVNPGKPVYAGPLFLLVDGGCYSACEDFVFPLLSTHRVRVIGETTAGSDGQTTVVDLGDGIAIGVSNTRYRLPDGQLFEGVGLRPDIIVEMHPEDLRARRDPVLARATELAKP